MDFQEFAETLVEDLYKAHRILPDGTVWVLEDNHSTLFRIRNRTRTRTDIHQETYEGPIDRLTEQALGDSELQALCIRSQAARERLGEIGTFNDGFYHYEDRTYPVIGTADL